MEIEWHVCSGIISLECLIDHQGGSTLYSVHIGHFGLLIYRLSQMYLVY